jgi:RND family efflux transporter MFP subunit
MTTHAEHPILPPSSERPLLPPHRAPERPAHRGRVAIAVVALLALAAIAVVTLLWRRHHAVSRRRSDLAAERAKGLRLMVTRVESTPAERVVTLPGDLRGYDQATIYAKVSGYVRDVLVERGDRVTRGQRLATIESPESQKDVATAQHDARIAAQNAQRADRLAPSGVLSQQERDNAVAQANVAEANLEKARALLAYTVVTAPFDGVVTARYVDPGALVPAATGGTQSALPIVDVTAVDTLRAFLYVGQDVASFVHPGDDAVLWEDEDPAARVGAKVTRTAGALDPRTRTMQVEIDFDNRPFHLLPGTFAHVELHVREPPAPLLPDDAIVIRDGKTVAALVEGGHVRFVPVELGYNDGSGVRVVRGLSGGETVGIDVPVEIQEGDAVQAVPRPAPPDSGDRKKEEPRPATKPG